MPMATNSAAFLSCSAMRRSGRTWLEHCCCRFPPGARSATTLAGMIPFARTKAERTASNDPRLSLRGTLQDHDGLRRSRVKAAAAKAVAQGFLLQAGCGQARVRAAASNVLSAQATASNGSLARKRRGPSDRAARTLRVRGKSLGAGRHGRPRVTALESCVAPPALRWRSSLPSSVRSHPRTAGRAWLTVLSTTDLTATCSRSTTTRTPRDASAVSRGMATLRATSAQGESGSATLLLDSAMASYPGAHRSNTRTTTINNRTAVDPPMRAMSALAPRRRWRYGNQRMYNRAAEVLPRRPGARP